MTYNVTRKGLLMLLEKQLQYLHACTYFDLSTPLVLIHTYKYEAEYSRECVEETIAALKAS